MHKAHLRRFGVEIECGMDGGVFQAGQLFNFRMEEDDWDPYPVSPNSEGWHLHDDGSGVELGSPILQGQEGFDTIRKAMDRLKSNDAYVTDYDGLHIHHDAPEFVEDPRLCLPLLESWLNNEDTIREFVSPRRRDRGSCPRWDERSLDQVQKWIDGDANLYLNRNDLNLYSLLTHETIEIRLMEGTLDADVAEAWIKFGQRFIYEVVHENKPLSSTPSSAELLARINLSSEARQILAAKQAAGHNTPGSRYMRRHPDDYYDEY